MFCLNPAILSRAGQPGLYTVGALSGLCFVGARAKSGTFMNMGGVLMCGLGLLMSPSLAPRADGFPPNGGRSEALGPGACDGLQWSWALQHVPLLRHSKDTFPSLAKQLSTLLG